MGFYGHGNHKGGKSLYQFTHRTFLEYFTAEYLTQTIRTPEKLLDELFPRIQKEQWQVVCELAFQLQAEKQEDDADKLISGLLKRLEEKELSSEETARCLFFALKCIEFLVISPLIIKKLNSLIVDNVLENRQSDGRYPLFDLLFTRNTNGIHRDNTAGFRRVF